jgi:hypothetical protein
MSEIAKGVKAYTGWEMSDEIDRLTAALAVEFAARRQDEALRMAEIDRQRIQLAAANATIAGLRAVVERLVKFRFSFDPRDQSNGAYREEVRRLQRDAAAAQAKVSRE